MRRAPRLPRAAAQNHGTGFLDLPRCLDDLTLVLDRARSRDRDHVGAAERDAARQPDDRVLGLPLAADLLVGLRDVDDFGDAGQSTSRSPTDRKSTPPTPAT